MKYFTFLKEKIYGSGQINQSMEIGRWIKHLSSLDSVNSIVEIGTFNGLGSSKCIADGVKNRTNQNVVVKGYESDRKLFVAAKKNLAAHSYFEIIYGSIVGVHELDSLGLTHQEKIWFDSDVLNITNSKDVFDTVPDSIDLLILDGGEFSTYGEFRKLFSRCRKFIILDDTHTRKNSKVYNHLVSTSNWALLDESNERNGVAVFLKCDDLTKP
jgi:hypothetical protein